MDRLLISGLIVLLAVLVALLMRWRQGRRTHLGSAPLGQIPGKVPPTELGSSGLAPASDTAAFIVVFTEATCRTCAAALRTSRSPAGLGLEVIEVEYGTHPELQKRLGIDTVPTTVVVQSDGAVLAGWSGKIDSAEFEAAVKQAIG